jgi:hypothetical protein
LHPQFARKNLDFDLRAADTTPAIRPQFSWSHGGRCQRSFYAFNPQTFGCTFDILLPDPSGIICLPVCHSDEFLSRNFFHHLEQTVSLPRIQDIDLFSFLI